jgi:hypothetical protein
MRPHERKASFFHIQPAGRFARRAGIYTNNMKNGGYGMWVFKFANTASVISNCNMQRPPAGKILPARQRSAFYLGPVMSMAQVRYKVR